ncbi:MAG TPA: ATP synthase F1 subunit epsilon [Stellaceae bacterium]|nr:ATP synthase F1 subunit epsilon [Stellaceae bacterium]
MVGKVKLELVSPERILVAQEVDMVVVPGTEGNFGVLPGHAPLISSVRPGVIDVYQGSEIVERIFVVGGFAEVTPLRCTVLADAALPISALDRDEAEAALAEARESLPAAREAAAKEGAGETERRELREAERQFRIATAKLDALGTTH